MLHGEAGTITGSPIQKYWDRNWKIKVLLSSLVAIFLFLYILAFPSLKQVHGQMKGKQSELSAAQGLTLQKKKKYEDYHCACDLEFVFKSR